MILLFLVCLASTPTESCNVATALDVYRSQPHPGPCGSSLRMTNTREASTYLKVICETSRTGLDPSELF